MFAGGVDTLFSVAGGHPKENGIQLSCIGWFFNVYFDVNDGRVSNSIVSLEHRCNLAYVSLFYRYYNGFCLNLFPRIIYSSFLATTLVWVDWSGYRTLYDKRNSFFSRTIRLWNYPCAEVVIFLLLSDEKRHKIQKNR